MNEGAAIKVMIVDDHPLVRIGMATVNNQHSDMAVVAEADGGPRALEYFRRHLPSWRGDLNR